MRKQRITKAEKEAEKAKRMQSLRAAHAIVVTGKCPTCGTKLYRNMSMAGWYQCGHLGAEGFQRETGPHCDFQIFYDPTPEQHVQIISEQQES